MNLTFTNQTTPRNKFLAHVLAVNCGPENVRVENFFSLPEFLFTACLFVTMANSGPTLMGLLVHLKQLFFYILSYVTCWSKKNSTSKVLPVATHDFSKVLPVAREEQKNKNDDSDQDDQENSDEEEEEEMIQKEQEEAMENAMDAQGGIVQCITEAFFGDTDEDAEDEEEEEEDEEDEEENERTRVVDMWMNVLHAALTLYSVWSYLLTYVPDNASMMCRASHMIIVPLFKPVAASMWPALMPLVQFAHWNSKRLTKRPEDYVNMSVLPGERPFELATHNSTRQRT